LNTLILQLYLSPQSSHERLHRFLHDLVRVVKADAFSTKPVGDWARTPPHQIIDAPDGVTLRMPLPEPGAVRLDLLRTVFSVPQALSEVPSALIRADIEPHPNDDIIATHTQPWWQPRADVPKFWSPAEPLMINIDFEKPMDPQTQLAWRAALTALEEVVANGPFLSSEEGIYSTLGSAQVHWLGAARAQYWIEAVACEASWFTLLGNQLFSPNGAAAAQRIVVTL
jgi:hypothetical protein